MSKNVKGEKMAKISNNIEEFLLQLLEEEEGSLEIQRSIIAKKFDCAPSQINYVLTTRFTPFKGFYVESRRGGGGFIRITRLTITEYGRKRENLFNEIGDSITFEKSQDIVEALYEMGKIDENEKNLIMAAISNRSLCKIREDRNEVRADILKNMIVYVLGGKEK